MHEIPGTRLRKERQHGLLRRFNRWFWDDLVLETIGEGVLVIAACLLLAGSALAVLWGYERAPKSTAALGVGLASLLTYGVVVLVRGATATKGIVASAAAAFCIFVGVWALYVIQYCSCI